MLLDSVLISIHNKNLLSIKKHTSKLVLSDSDNNGNRSTSCFFFVFGSFNHQLLFKLRSTQILQTKRKKALKLKSQILSISQLPKESLYLFNFYLTSMWQTQWTLLMSIIKSVMQFLTFYAIWQPQKRLERNALNGIIHDVRFRFLVK